MSKTFAIKKTRYNLCKKPQVDNFETVELLLSLALLTAVLVLASYATGGILL